MKTSLAIEVESLLLCDKELVFSLSFLAEFKGDVSVVDNLLLCILGGGGIFESVPGRGLLFRHLA